MIHKNTAVCCIFDDTCTKHDFALSKSIIGKLLVSILYVEKDLYLVQQGKSSLLDFPGEI